MVSADEFQIPVLRQAQNVICISIILAVQKGVTNYCRRGLTEPSTNNPTVDKTVEIGPNSTTGFRDKKLQPTFVLQPGWPDVGSFSSKLLISCGYGRTFSKLRFFISRKLDFITSSVAGPTDHRMPAQQQYANVTRQPWRTLNLKALINSIIHHVQLVATNNPPSAKSFLLVQVRPLASLTKFAKAGLGGTRHDR